MSGISIAIVLALSGPALAAGAPADCAGKSVSRLVAEESGLLTFVWNEFYALQLCRALALEDSAECAALSPRSGDAGRHVCGHFYHQALFSKAAISRSPGAARACEEMFARENGAVPAALAKRACASLARGDVDKGCALLKREIQSTKEFSIDRCATDLNMFLGTGDCDKFPADARGFCRGAVAYRLAKAGDSWACQAEPYCRAFSGEGAAACAPLEEKVKTKVCGKDSPWTLRRKAGGRGGIRTPEGR